MRCAGPGGAFLSLPPGACARRASPTRSTTGHGLPSRRAAHSTSAPLSLHCARWGRMQTGQSSRTLSPAVTHRSICRSVGCVACSTKRPSRCWLCKTDFRLRMWPGSLGHASAFLWAGRLRGNWRPWGSGLPSAGSVAHGFTSAASTRREESARARSQGLRVLTGRPSLGSPKHSGRSTRPVGRWRSCYEVRSAVGRPRPTARCGW